mmetsp:Transcript_10968/g.33402  ORF Transcript_10968/g.33402 Transcript_10968/m.33402 type:complete len:597 (+) Transcript_10968:94-1884(+)
MSGLGLFLEVELAAAKARPRAKLELAAVGGDRRRDALVLIVVHAEVRLDDVDGLVVDVVELVRLQLLDLLEAVGLPDVPRHLVVPGAVLLRVHLAHLENVLEALYGHANDLRVAHGEQLAERRDAALLHEVAHLLRRAPRRRVADGPGRLLADVELGVLQQMHERRDDVGRDDLLDLLLRPRRDVADGPARLLADALLGRPEQGQQVWERPQIDDDLRLQIVARHDIPHGAQRRRLHRKARVHQQLHEAPRHPRLDDALDALVRAVAEVRSGPARVRKHLLVEGVDELRERRQRNAHEVEIGRRLAAAQVGQRPGRVAQHAQTRVVRQLLEQRLQRARADDEVAARRRVAGDVPQRPHGLLAHFVVRRREQLHEDGHGAALDDHVRVVRRARGDVRQRPGRLELQVRVVAAPQELHKLGHHAGVDHVLDGRVALDAQEPAEVHGHLVLHRGVVRLQAFHHLRDLGDLHRQRRVDGRAAVSPRRRPRRRRHGAHHRLRRRSDQARRFRRAPALVQAVLALVLADLDGRLLAPPPRVILVHALLEVVAARCVAVRVGRHCWLLFASPCSAAACFAKPIRWQTCSREGASGSTTPRAEP